MVCLLYVARKRLPLNTGASLGKQKRALAYTLIPYLVYAAKMHLSLGRASIGRQKRTVAYMLIAFFFLIFTLMALFAQRDSESFIIGDWSQYIGRQKRTVAYTQMVLFALHGSDTCITEHWSQSVKIKEYLRIYVDDFVCFTRPR